jgi:hypothetical protein
VELERLWLEFAYLDNSGGNINMVKFGRAPEEGEPELVAALEMARGELIRVEGEAATAVGDARSSVTLAQSRLDVFRRDLIRSHAAEWRRHAERLRLRAAESGDETTVVSVMVQGGVDGARMEPRLEFTRNVLADQAARADATASHLEGRLLAGDALAGESLALLVTQLEPLPDEALESTAA